MLRSHARNDPARPSWRNSGTLRTTTASTSCTRPGGNPRIRAGSVSEGPGVLPSLTLPARIGCPRSADEPPAGQDGPERVEVLERPGLGGTGEVLPEVRPDPARAALPAADG